MSAARTHRPTRARASLFALTLVAGLLAACSSGAGSGSSDGVALRIDAPWIRVPMNAAGPAGAFMTIANTGTTADALIGASSPAATAVEVHETKMNDDGTMGMSPVGRLEIPAGGSVELKSGSYHIMLIGLKQPLTAGSTVELTLTFEKAGPVTATAEVRAG